MQSSFCPSCGGATTDHSGAKCPTCEGTGILLRSRHCSVCRCLGYIIKATRPVPFMRAQLCPACARLYHADRTSPAFTADEPWPAVFGRVTEARAAQLGHPGQRAPVFSRAPGRPIVDYRR